MSEFTKYKDKMIAIFLWLIFLFLLFWVTSCDISKKAIKNKVDETKTTEKTETENKSVFDFGTVDLKEFSINYEPLSHTNIMWLITKKGDTLKSQNAKFTISKTEAKTQNNKQETTSSQITTIDFERLIQLAKEKEKTESFDTGIILYVVAGVVILGMFAFWLVYRSINKNTKAITAIVNNLSK